MNDKAIKVFAGLFGVVLVAGIGGVVWLGSRPFIRSVDYGFVEREFSFSGGLLNAGLTGSVRPRDPADGAMSSVRAAPYTLWLSITRLDELEKETCGAAFTILELTNLETGAVTPLPLPAIEPFEARDENFFNVAIQVEGLAIDYVAHRLGFAFEISGTCLGPLSQAEGTLEFETKFRDDTITYFDLLGYE